MARSGIRKPPAERKKEIADAITYAFGHWIRLEAQGGFLSQSLHSLRLICSSPDRAVENWSRPFGARVERLARCCLAVALAQW